MNRSLTEADVRRAACRFLRREIDSAKLNAITRAVAGYQEVIRKQTRGGKKR